MKKIILIFVTVLLTQTGCDLKPKIQNLPDSVGDFISERYPALLADPNENPEIYNSAASDYGVYVSPELYGHDDSSDYVMYASVDDYVTPEQVAEYGMPPQVDTGEQIVVEDTTQKYQPVDDYLVVPIYGGTQKNVASAESKDDVLTIKKPNAAVKSVKRVELKDVRVVSGDTLYSLSRKYSVPVNDLAVINNLQPPFNLSVGQILRVPNLNNDVAVKRDDKVTVVKTEKAQKTGVKEEMVSVKKVEKKKDSGDKSVQKKVESKEKKISSDPSKKLPKIVARSSSRFSWPVRGKILSNYGAKSNGLFNDGINISASRGTAVRAAENGVVAYAGNEIKGMGNLVIVQHADGWMTVYAHMDSMIVRRGARVKVGDKIGTVGQTGKVDSPQLHFEIRKGTKAYNPSSYLKN